MPMSPEEQQAYFAMLQKTAEKDKMSSMYASQRSQTGQSPSRMTPSEEQAYMAMLKKTAEKDQMASVKPRSYFIVGSDDPPADAEVVEWDVMVEEAAPTVQLPDRSAELKAQQDKEEQERLRQQQASALAELERRQEQQAAALAAQQAADQAVLEQRQKQEQRSLLDSQPSPQPNPYASYTSSPPAQTAPVGSPSPYTPQPQPQPQPAPASVYPTPPPPTTTFPPLSPPPQQPTLGAPTWAPQRNITLFRAPGAPGEATGVGIMFTKGTTTQNDPYCIFKITLGAPAGVAASQGQLFEGEWLHAVNGTPVHGLQSAQVRDLIKGTPNTPVVLTLSPPST